MNNEIELYKHYLNITLEQYDLLEQLSILPDSKYKTMAVEHSMDVLGIPDKTISLEGFMKTAFEMIRQFFIKLFNGIKKMFGSKSSDLAKATKASTDAHTKLTTKAFNMKRIVSTTEYKITDDYSPLFNKQHELRTAELAKTITDFGVTARKIYDAIKKDVPILFTDLTPDDVDGSNIKNELDKLVGTNPVTGAITSVTDRGHYKITKVKLRNDGVGEFTFKGDIVDTLVNDARNIKVIVDEVKKIDKMHNELEDIHEKFTDGADKVEQTELMKTNLNKLGWLIFDGSWLQFHVFAYATGFIDLHATFMDELTYND